MGCDASRSGTVCTQPAAHPAELMTGRRAVGPATPVHVYKPDSTTAVRDGLWWGGLPLPRDPRRRGTHRH